MTIFNLGSVNLDHVYRVATLPTPGETIAARAFSSGLGGKGANQSLAIARSGGRVRHVGAIGADGVGARAALLAAGVNVDHLASVDVATGHAIILVDDAGENMIVIHGGANRAVPMPELEAALFEAAAGDWFLTQNETNLVAEAIAAARQRRLRIAYAAAPFDAAVTGALLTEIDLLAVNAGEAAALAAHLGCTPETLPVPAALITLGAGGAVYRAGDENGVRTEHRIGPVVVDPVDTTGAGDTFLGVFLAALDGGEGVEAGLSRAAAAAALQVTRPGAAAAIPTAKEVQAFMRGRPVPEVTRGGVG